MSEANCNRCNRQLIGRQTKFCSHKCANSYHARQRSALSKKAEWKSCDVPDCEKPARSRTAELCPMHYHRVYRYGSLNPVHEPTYTDITGRTYGKLTVIGRTPGGGWRLRCECGAMTIARYGNLERGDKVTCGDRRVHWRQANNYRAAHDYVRRDRGQAKRYPCVDCHAPAKHWSYSHQDPNEQRDWAMQGAPYFSTDPAYYEPRCVSCHKYMDLQVASRRALHAR